MRTMTTALLGLMAGVSIVAGQQAPAPVGYDDTPMQPNGRWHIHDGKRPQPPIVTPGPTAGMPNPTASRNPFGKIANNTRQAATAPTIWDTM